MAPDEALSHALEGLSAEQTTLTLAYIERVIEAWILPRAQLASIESAAWMLLHIREEIALHQKRILSIEGPDSKWLVWLVEFDRRFEAWGEKVLGSMAEAIDGCAPDYPPILPETHISPSEYHA